MGTFSNAHCLTTNDFCFCQNAFHCKCQAVSFSARKKMTKFTSLRAPSDVTKFALYIAIHIPNRLDNFSQSIKTKQDE